MRKQHKDEVDTQAAGDKSKEMKALKAMYK